MNEKAEKMPEENARRKLYEQQKLLLDTFLAHGTITEAQYRKSLGDLTVKMGMETPPFNCPKEGKR